MLEVGEEVEEFLGLEIDEIEGEVAVKDVEGGVVVEDDEEAEDPVEDTEDEEDVEDVEGRAEPDDSARIVEELVGRTRLVADEIGTFATGRLAGIGAGAFAPATLAETASLSPDPIAVMIS